MWKYKSFFLLLIFSPFFSGCAGSRQGSEVVTLEDLISQTQAFQENHFGFKLYDLEEQEVVYEENSHKYFTPASNTKLLTFYVSLQSLADSTLGFYYRIENDTMMIWGTGDPTFLHPEFEQNERLFYFLKSFSGVILYSDNHFTNQRFGPGWAWDDYIFGYSQEMSPWPIYGNELTISIDSLNKLSVLPSFFKDSVLFEMPQNSLHNKFHRAGLNNKFYLNPEHLGELKERERTIPLHMNSDLFVKMLKDTLGRDIGLADIPFDTSSIRIPGVPIDTVYRKMMRESDNFLAEQLLLQSGFIYTLEINTKKAIDTLTQLYLNGLPDQPIWKDGSGLSRYNLFTPATMVDLLIKIQDAIPQERLFSILPAGGLNGTIESWYGHQGTPYIYAKTGTLSNNHSLSGYLIARSGKLYVFSFMHNNYPYSSSVVKEAMQPILEFVRDNN